MRAAVLLTVLTLLAACHPRAAVPVASCPPPRVVTHTRVVHDAPPRAKPLTAAQRRSAALRAAELRAEADRLDAKVKAMLRVQPK